MPYENLTVEMTKRQVTKKELSKSLGLHNSTVAYKLKKGFFTIEEADQIQREYFPNVPLGELFKKG